MARNETSFHGPFYCPWKDCKTPTVDWGNLSTLYDHVEGDHVEVKSTSIITMPCGAMIIQNPDRELTGGLMDIHLKTCLNVNGNGCGNQANWNIPPPRRLRCPYQTCGRWRSTKKLVVNHIALDHGTEYKFYHCPDCDEMLTWRADWTQGRNEFWTHMFTKHEPSVRIKPNNNDDA